MEKTRYGNAVEAVALAQSSLDYPGPCQQEAVAANSPQFIATSNRSGFPNERIYHFAKIDLSDTGRFKLGISCTRTKFMVLRGGPGSALCTQRQNCGPNLPPEDFEWAVDNGGLPYNERPFVHHCDKHGFGWYDATMVPPGSYFVAAKSGSIPIVFEGHGTMDSYARYTRSLRGPEEDRANGQIEIGASVRERRRRGECSRPERPAGERVYCPVVPASAFGGLQPGITPRQPGHLFPTSRLSAAMLLALITACSAGDATAPDAPPPGPRDGSSRDRDPVAPDAEAKDLRPADERAPIADTGSADRMSVPDAAPAAEAGSPCTRPPADQPWIRAYQDDLVARLAGARALPAGGMLGVRASAGSRTATRQFLADQFKDIGLTAQLHNYGSGQNVQAELKATAGANEYVVFGAHFDTVAGSPGANDNATGVAAVFSAARYLQLLPCRSRHVLFVLFDEEEDGLVGSEAFARKLKTDGVRVHSVHTIDQMGWDMDGDQRIEVELPDKGLRELYLAAATDLGWNNPATAIVMTNVSSTDHASFRPDFPAIGLTEEYRSGDTTPHYHKPTDTYATVNLDYLKHTTVLIHHVFADLLSPTPLFADRLPRPQVILRDPSEIDFKSRSHAGRQPRLYRSSNQGSAVFE